MWMRQGGKGCVEFEKGFSTLRKLHKQVNRKAKYLESGPINVNRDFFLFYFCTIGKLVNAFHIAKGHSFVSVHFYLLTLILSVTTCIQACCLIFRMEVKSECSPSHQFFPRVTFSPLCLRELANFQKNSLLLLGNWYFFHHIDSFTFFWTKRLVWFILYDCK